jgi:hypothetical protein
MTFCHVVFDITCLDIVYGKKEEAAMVLPFIWWPRALAALGLVEICPLTAMVMQHICIVLCVESGQVLSISVN